jgi:PmbA protein
LAGADPRASSEALIATAARAVERARAAGAAEAEACAVSARAFTVRVGAGEVESLKHSVTRGLGLRVLVGGALGFVSGTDLGRDALDDLARRAVAIARFSTPDPANGLPTPDEAAETAPPEDLELFDPALLELTPERKIAMALTLERVALSVDPRIRRTDGALVSSSDGTTAIVNSHGLTRVWSGTGVHAWVVALADDRDGKQQSGSRYVARRWLADVPDLELLARAAAQRALARVGARPVPTARVPVVMHPDVAESWIAEMHDAFSGESVLKQASWLTGKLGATIASPLVTLVDDGRMRRGAGSDPYDGEGVPTRRNVLIDRGRCAMYLYDTYHARRAGARSTGSGTRSWSSVPGIGHHNLHLEAGGEAPAAILARVDRGFYMDDQGSYGFNAVTGDYSFQAQGFWIERGEKAFPVEGVTVASNSLDMLRNIVAVGNDLEFDASVAAPTILIAEMTVGGAAP